MIRPQFACRAHVTPRELADHQRRAHRVDRELPAPRRGGHPLEGPAKPISLGRGEGIGQPPARVVDQDVDRAQLLLGNSNSSAGAAGSDRSASTAAALPPSSRMRARTAVASCAW